MSPRFVIRLIILVFIIKLLFIAYTWLVDVESGAFTCFSFFFYATMYVDCNWHPSMYCMCVWTAIFDALIQFALTFVLQMLFLV